MAITAIATKKFECALSGRSRSADSFEPASFHLFISLSSKQYSIIDARRLRSALDLTWSQIFALLDNYAGSCFGRAIERPRQCARSDPSAHRSAICSQSIRDGAFTGCLAWQLQIDSVNHVGTETIPHLQPPAPRVTHAEPA
jgi:hypothetical protein